MKLYSLQWSRVELSLSCDQTVPYISVTLSNTSNYLHDGCRDSTAGDIAVNQNTAELSTVYSRKKLHINYKFFIPYAMRHIRYTQIHATQKICINKDKIWRVSIIIQNEGRQ